MAKQKSVLQQVGDSIKAGATAIVDVAQAALTAASDLPNGGGYTPVKDQRWVREIEANKPKKSKKRAGKTGKKATKKKAAKKKLAKTTAKKSKKKSKKKRL
jgi:hypothetical protein